MTGSTGRQALRRLTPVVVIGVVLTTLTACFPTAAAPRPAATGLSSPGLTAPLAPLVVPAVLSYCPLETAVHDDSYSLPTDEVFICRGDGRRDSDWTSTYGPWETAYRIVHPAKLLAAYRVPNEPIDHANCTYETQDPLIIWVHRNGNTEAYYAPVDGCGNPSPASRDAYGNATRITLVDVDRGAPDPTSPTTSKKDSTG